MRNILEYYFSFQCNEEKLTSSLNKLANSEDSIEYKAFYRYMNGGSHNVGMNISNLSSIPSDNYFNLFRNIFKEMDSTLHYQTMLQDEATSEDNS